MRRKCMQVLSVVLAVLMIVPCAVFTGAATTLTATVTGSIDKDSGEVVTVAGKTNSATVYVAVGGEITVNLTPADNYKAATGEKTTDKGASYPTQNSANKAVIHGTAAGTDVYTFTSEPNKTGKAQTFKLTVTVLNPVLVKMEVFAMGKDNKEVNLNTLTAFDPGDTLTITRADLYYSNEIASPVPVGVESLHIQLDGKDVTSPIVLKGGDSKITVTMDGTKVTNTYPIVVKGQTISKIEIQKAPGAKAYTDKDTVVDKKDIQVVVNGSMIVMGDAYTLKMYTDASKKQTADKLTKDVYLTVTYEGVESEPVKADSVLNFSADKPVAIQVDVTKATKKAYIEGETLNDFTGVTVKVAYSQAPNTFVEIEPARVKFSAFVYGDRSITASYTENGETVSCVVNTANFTISRKQVKSIEVANASSVKTKYEAGEKLNLDGLQIKLVYNSGVTETVSYANQQFTLSPRNGDELTKDDKFVLIVYSDPNTGYELSTQLPLTITNATGIKEVVSINEGKKDYFIGESFKKEGFQLLLIYTDGKTEKIDLSKCSSVTFTSPSAITSAGKFTAAYTGSVEMVVKVKSTDTAKTIRVDGISVTKRPVLESITVEAEKYDYLESEVPVVKDFRIVARYDDRSTRVFEVEETDAYANMSSMTKLIDNVTYSVRILPEVVEATTKQLQIAYTERVSGAATVTRYATIDIKVTVPECTLTTLDTTASSVYKRTVTKPYESLYKALEDAKDGDTIQLRKDVTMSYDYPVNKNLTIDTNGYALTMIRGMLYVSSSAYSTTKVTFSNSNRTKDGSLVYGATDDDTIVLAYNKTYVIDRTTTGVTKYKITLVVGRGGKVTGPTEVVFGHDAQFTITPDEGYEIASLTVAGKKQTVPEDGVVKVVNIQKDFILNVTFQEKVWNNPFTDVFKTDSYYSAVEFVYENGLFKGTSTTQFEPNTTMTRAMFVTVLGRLTGINTNRYTTTSFPDVQAGQWYSAYVEWASSIGLVQGYEDGTFRPDDPINHNEMYVLMERYARLILKISTDATGTSISANDERDVPDWAYDAVKFAFKYRFMVMSSYRLTPEEYAKRYELAMLLRQFCVNVMNAKA